MNDNDWQVKESSRMQQKGAKFVTVLIVSIAAGWISSFFMESGTQYVVFSAGLAVYYLWDGIEKKR